MKQVLSQQEIDSLLNALDTGEIDSESLEQEEEQNKVRSYDFRRPIKLSKEYMNTLYMIFENFSKIVGNLLSSQVNSSVDVALGAVEQISYDEFIRSIPRVTLIGIFQTEPLGGVQLLEINPQFCMQVIELVCGGIDSSRDYNHVFEEEFTDIELGILEETVGVILQSFESAWSDVVEVTTKIDDLETNPQLVQTMSPNEPVVLISFTVELLGERTFMNICMPFVSLENVMEKLSFRSWFDFEKETSDEDRSALEDRIKSSDVDISVELGRSTVTVRDFLNLELGDVVTLDTLTTDPLKMCIEEIPHYLVKPGEIKGRLAVEVLKYVEEDVEI